MQGPLWPIWQTGKMIALGTFGAVVLILGLAAVFGDLSWTKQGVTKELRDYWFVLAVPWLTAPGYYLNLSKANKIERENRGLD